MEAEVMGSQCICFGWRVALVVSCSSALLLGCGSSGGGGSRPNRPNCAGSGLVGDTFNSTVCSAPPATTDDCTASAIKTFPTLFPEAGTSSTTPRTFAAEASATVDRASNENWAYVATIEAVLGSNSSNPLEPPSCILEKTIKVLRSRNGGNWEELSGLPVPNAIGGTNPANPGGLWVTDPWLDVGPDGTLFLSVLADRGTPDCVTTAVDADNDRLSEVELFTMPRGGSTLTQVATTTGGNCGPSGVCSAISAGTNESNAGGSGLDHPRMAVSRTDPSLAVVTWLRVSGTDLVRTLRKDASGNWNVSTSGLPSLPVGKFSFANPAFDGNGDLYIAHAPVPSSASPALNSPLVHRFHLDTGTGNWTLVSTGGPAQDSAITNTTTTNFAANVPVDPTPAIRVVNFPLNADPIVYLAYTVDGDANAATPFVPSVHLTAVNANGLGTPAAWLPPIAVPRPTPAANWAQAMDVDPAANALDLLYYSLDDATVAGAPINTFLERRRASDPTKLSAGPTQLTTTGPLLTDLPGRTEGEERTFAGEYVALATNGNNAIVGFPQTSSTAPDPLSGAAHNIDIDVGAVETLCAEMRTLSLGTGAFLPDNIWECDCNCGGVISNVSGCASGPLAAADACAQVCVESDCGEASSCPTLRECVSTGAGRRKFVDGCARDSGPSIGSNPALFADYFANDDGGSHATFHFNGDSATTQLTGSVSVNVSDGVPSAGSSVEVSRLQLAPHAFDVGGLIGARVRGITMAHVKRFRGTFTDATHFTVPTNAGEVVTEFSVDPDGPSWLTGDTTTNRRAAYNSGPMQGTLDLATGKLTLTLTLGSPGNDMVATFSGALAAAPIDSDGDGIVDPLDNCPNIPNPDQVDAPPVLSPVSTLEIEQCTAASVLSFPAPTATDACTPDEVTIEGAVTQINGLAQDPPIFLTNNQGSFPSTYPSGNVVVHWTATDGHGNSSSVDQTFELRSDHTGPAFDLVPPDQTTTKCTGVALGQAFGEDTCGGSVSVSNNAPSKFPLGTTVVTWTAVDARGNSRAATQVVTALLGDDSSCCPAGTHVIIGTPNNDTLNGTSGSDCILGLGAQDTINGNGGDDFISGGEGNDTINGGDGNDMIFGGSGQDVLNGNNGNDTLSGGDGDDQLFGGSGDDILRGGQGQDTLRGDDGNDQLFGGTGSDNLQGGNGNDLLAGDSASDTCTDSVGINVFEQCEFGAANSCGNGVKDGNETAVDCGGGCLPCGMGATCNSGGDCLSNVCSAAACQGLPHGVALQPVVDTDWGGGYCVHLNVTNVASAPTLTWSASLNTNQSTIYTASNATITPTSGVVTVTPSVPGTQVVNPAETDGSVSFCANRSVPSSGTLPFVLSATGSY